MADNVSKLAGNLQVCHIVMFASQEKESEKGRFHFKETKLLRELVQSILWGLKLPRSQNRNLDFCTFTEQLSFSTKVAGTKKQTGNHKAVLLVQSLGASEETQRKGVQWLYNIGESNAPIIMKPTTPTPALTLCKIIVFRKQESQLNGTRCSHAQASRS